MRRLSLLSLVIAAFALTGCPTKYPKCKTDDQCKDHGEVCVNGACQECGTDENCKAGFSCVQAKCVPKAECQADADCTGGFKCRASKCVPECTSAGDCAQGMQCKEGRCAPEPQCLSDADCAAGLKCDANQRCSEPVATEACTLETVYFDFNESSLTGQARSALDKNADCIKRSPGTVTLAGHADERGTEEYNLHLGERRANAAKKYLTALGVEGSKLRTVSFGEERPANPGHDEAAWSENRRVEFSR